MTRSPQGREFVPGDNISIQMLRVLTLGAGVLLLLLAGLIQLAWQQQMILASLLVVLAAWMNRRSRSYLVTLTVVLLSCFATFRYACWRVATVARILSDSRSRWTPFDALLMGLLLAAEGFAFAVLLLGYLQTLWPLRRAPAALPPDPELWPEVDLLITTLDEPLSLVRYTVLAALNLDWPDNRLNIYLLDDGRRAEFRAFAEEAGVGYMICRDNEHGQAGNLNRALQRLDAPFVAIFNADQAPARSFLQMTVGWFGRDARLGMLQTPQQFYSPDPIERNLDQFRAIPSESELFYGLVQDGNDLWNAALFCGSCAVVRRAALDDVGGFAVETSAEDMHTSLRMQKRGWNTAYINLPQAAGVAPRSLRGYLRQRMRWTRGMAQLLHSENPLLAQGLNPAQRLCYMSAMLHLLSALPRLIFLTAPLAYLIFGLAILPGYWAAILAYAIPHLALSTVANSRLRGRHRYSFWTAIYETLIAPYTLFPGVLALFFGRAGQFNAREDDRGVKHSFFDIRSAWPFLLLLLLNVAGLLCAIPRAVRVSAINTPRWAVPLARMYDSDNRGTIAVYVLWASFNLIILGVAVSVARERRQRRAAARVPAQIAACVVLRDDAVLPGTIADLSTGGLQMRTAVRVDAAPGDPIRVVLPAPGGEAMLPAVVVEAGGNVLRARFDPLTLAQEMALTSVLYSRADRWLGWGEAPEPDRPLVSFGGVLWLSVRGLARALGGTRREREEASVLKTGAALLLITLALLTGARAQSSQSAKAVASSALATPAHSGAADGGSSPGTFTRSLTLAQMGVGRTIVLRGDDSVRHVAFSIPQTELVKSARMRLRFQASPGLIPQISQLNVSLNGVLFATLPVSVQPATMIAAPGLRSPGGTEPNRMTPKGDGIDAVLSLPAELLVHDNDLTFEFAGHYTTRCEDPSNSVLWARVDASSSLEFTGRLIALQNDLKLLPLPFYDSAATLHPSVPIVFLRQPSPKALQAVGIVASWFGSLADRHAVRFPVSFGTIPPGNAIVFADRIAELPAEWKLADSAGPTIAMRPNPFDLYSKLLIVTGNTPGDLLTAAKVLALRSGELAGETAQVAMFSQPAPRASDDAPRWLRTDRLLPLGEFARPVEPRASADSPLEFDARLPPDLYYGSLENLPLRLDYRYNGVPLRNGSTLQVSVNGDYISSTPLPHSSRASASLSTVVPVPVASMRPFANSIAMQFAFRPARAGNCSTGELQNLRGSVLKSSYLDLRNIPHWVTLPNLELFASAGYPFTRWADLSRTVVVMPSAPGAEEVETFLTLMGHFGAQTGYPVLGVGVTGPAGVRPRSQDSLSQDSLGEDYRGKDFLVLGTAADLPVFAGLRDSLPVGIRPHGLRVQNHRSFLRPLQRIWRRLRGLEPLASSEELASGDFGVSGEFPDALIEGAEWPRGSGRSVVVIALRDRGAAAGFLDAFLAGAPVTNASGTIAQSVSVLKGDRFSSFRAGSEVYHVGTLPLWIRLTLWSSRFPWLLVALATVVCFVMAVLLRTLLRGQARRRLGIEE